MENTAQLELPGTVARLKSRVYRAPASLAPYHFYLEPGTTVYITGHAGGIPRCTTIENKAARVSEDYFAVPYADLEIIERPAPNRMTLSLEMEKARAEVWEVWGELGELDVAVGPANGGVAVCQITTATGEGRFTRDSMERAARNAPLIAAAPALHFALMHLQANPNDPRAHRLALDALALIHQP